MRLPLLLAALLLASCSPDAPRVANRTPTERAVLAEKKLAVPPVPRTYPVGKGEMVVVEVPVADSQHFVDKQRCMVYRDLELKQVTMSCGQQPETLVVAP